MDNPLIITDSQHSLAALDSGIPALFVQAGEGAAYRFIEFFTANIHNPNTRRAYYRAVTRFSYWCTRYGVELTQVNPVLVAKYVQELGTEMQPPTVKQHLAAIRMLFDYLVTGQIVPLNPAAAVKGPKYVIKVGKTPVLSAAETRELLDVIDTSRVIGLRDRALIGVMVFSFARVSAVVGMNVEDYFQKGKRWWFRLHEKGGKYHEVPAHHKAEEYLDAYLAAAGIAGAKKTPLFRSFNERRQLTERRLHRSEVWAMIKRRARQARLSEEICCHTFRATGITTYLENGGTIERAQQIAAHESPKTTKLYDRTQDPITLEEVERIRI
ncbi:MAG: integrase [Chloroflexi bacterium]|nr:MAG: integrase [Chloroflexota bacterium]